MAKSNSTVKKTTQVIALILIIIGGAITYGVLTKTVSQVEKTVETKVDQDVFDECMKGVEREIGHARSDISLIRAEQRKQADTLTQILIEVKK